MGVRQLVAQLMSEILSVVAHPERFKLIEELAGGEKDVDQIVKFLQIPQSTVSQHLSVLRVHRLVIARRAGRHVYYSLRHPWLAKWLLEGLQLLEKDDTLSEEILTATKQARKLWTERRHSS
jgi:DNA-binding transcriptional ArsR family regulator